MKLIKQLSALFLILINSPYIPTFGHGFGTHTFVHMADESLDYIGMLCRRTLDKKLMVTSYDAGTATLTNALIKRCGTSTTNRSVRFCFTGSLDNTIYDKIICTPIQEFYSPSSHRWIPAYQLHAGDKLLCKHTIKTIADIEYVKEPYEN